MSALSDIGKAENQPVTEFGVWLERDEAKSAEIARLSAENKRLRATIEAQQRQLKAFFGRDPSPFDAPDPLPRQEQEPVAVHPPASVTHRGAQ